MPHYVAFYLCLHRLPKCLLRGFRSSNGLEVDFIQLLTIESDEAIRSGSTLLIKKLIQFLECIHRVSCKVSQARRTSL